MNGKTRNLRTATASAQQSGWRKLFQPLLWVLLLAAACGTASAQFDSGAVLGNIKDATGASVPGASVALLSVATGTKVMRQADGSGSYEFDSVQPGEYRVSVSANGFELSQTDVFHVNIGARQRVDLALKLGAISDTVTISGAATQLETETSDRGETIQGQEAVALPLNGRSYADLAQLVPGCVARSSPPWLRCRLATPRIT